MYTIHLQHVSLATRMVLSDWRHERRLEKLAAFLTIDMTGVHDEQTYVEYRGRVPSELAVAGGS